MEQLTDEVRGMIDIPLQAPVEEVERILRAHGVNMRQQYARDEHFSKYVLAGITSLPEAYAFLAQLERDRYFQHVLWPGCTKARSARYALERRDGFWIESPDRIRSAIAHTRRTCCGCHATGSFAPSPSFHWDKTPKARVRRVMRNKVWCRQDEGGWFVRVSVTGLDLGRGPTPQAAWAAADQHQLDRYMANWWAGSGKNLEPTIVRDSGNAPVLSPRKAG